MNLSIKTRPVGALTADQTQLVEKSAKPASVPQSKSAKPSPQTPPYPAGRLADAIQKCSSQWRAIRPHPLTLKFVPLDQENLEVDCDQLYQYISSKKPDDFLKELEYDQFLRNQDERLMVQEFFPGLQEEALDAYLKTMDSGILAPETISPFHRAYTGPDAVEVPSRENDPSLNDEIKNIF